MSRSAQDNIDGPDSTSPPDPHQQAHQVPSSLTAQAEMAQAFKDLARGEQQAAAIEANLASLESKLDALLASIEAGADLVNGDGTADRNSKTEHSPEHK
ncbi:hypothetical protein F4802DRAFT_436574 [Xylaria palmicola]|nr:hypothetical protein F4802DRAFT_436574 [Xylaria palmicola]